MKYSLCLFKHIPSGCFHISIFSFWKGREQSARIQTQKSKALYLLKRNKVPPSNWYYLLVNSDINDWTSEWIGDIYPNTQLAMAAKKDFITQINTGGGHCLSQRLTVHTGSPAIAEHNWRKITGRFDPTTTTMKKLTRFIKTSTMGQPQVDFRKISRIYNKICIEGQTISKIDVWKDCVAL